MEESRAKLKKTATESLRGRLLAEDVECGCNYEDYSRGAGGVHVVS